MAVFPNKVFKGADRGFKNFTDKGKEFLATSRIKSEIKSNQVLIQNKFTSLGKKVYEMLINSNLNEEALKNDCERITSLYKKITELDMEISKIEEEILKRRYGENVVLCPKCTTVNKSDDKFCKSCGTNLQEEVAAEQYKCSVCGATLKKSEKFCQRCGKKRGD